MAKDKSISTYRDDKCESNNLSDKLKKMLRTLAELEYEFFIEQKAKQTKENK